MLFFLNLVCTCFRSQTDKVYLFWAAARFLILRRLRYKTSLSNILDVSAERWETERLRYEQRSCGMGRPMGAVVRWMLLSVFVFFGSLLA